jgi:ribosomal protein S27E
MRNFDDDPKAIEALDYLRSKFTPEQIRDVIIPYIAKKQDEGKYWQFDVKTGTCPKCKNTVSVYEMSESCPYCNQILFSPVNLMNYYQEDDSNE